MLFHIPTKIYFERGCLASHGSEMAKLGSKAAIFTGRSSSKQNGSLSDVCQTLEQQAIPYAIFDNISPNPAIEEVIKSAEVAAAQGVDFCVGVGGGSAIDAAKAVAVLLANKNTSDIENLFFCERNAAHLPVVAIPTTCGTGSEATPFSVLTDSAKRTKRTIFSRIFPNIAFVDYTYLRTSNYSLFVVPCIDALAHLIKSYLTVRSNEYNRLFAREGLRKWGSAKEILQSEAEFKQAGDGQLEQFMAAAMFGGMSIAMNGTCLPHGLANPISYEMNMPHGKAVSIFLPGFLKNYGDKDLVLEILSFLGVASLDDLEEFLYQILGCVEIPSNIWENDLDLMMGNTHKLSSYPYLMEREILDNYRCKLFSVVRN